MEAAVAVAATFLILKKNKESSLSLFSILFFKIFIRQRERESEKREEMVAQKKEKIVLGCERIVWRESGRGLYHLIKY
jgi:hypothetical protein